jgi:uncharacterized alpha-E superfamily protein
MMLSRVADSLYWMSRYLERAEHIARLLGMLHETLLESDVPDDDASWRRVLASLDALPPGTSPGTYRVSGSLAYRVTGLLTFDPHHLPSITQSIMQARDNARQVREQTSTEMWEQLNRLYLALRSMTLREMWRGETIEFYHDVINDLHLFHGITDATMSHGEGWHFIQLGRYMERAQLVAALLAIHYGGSEEASAPPAETTLEWINLLKMCTAFEAYCKVYTADVQPGRIAEYLVFDPDFPRSIRFAVDMVQTQLQRIAPESRLRRSSRAERIAGRLRALLDFGDVEEIMGDAIQTRLKDIENQIADIHDAVFESYIYYPVDAHIG